MLLCDGVWRINDQAFAYTPIEEVVLPKSVTSIANGWMNPAFKGCTSVKEVYLHADSTLDWKGAFSGSSDIKLYRYRTVTINEAEHGTVKAVDAKAPTNLTLHGNYFVTGAAVTVQGVPEKGYKVKSITVTDKDGNPVELTNNTFIMPDNDDLVISATFEADPNAGKPTQPTSGGGGGGGGAGGASAVITETETPKAATGAAIETAAETKNPFKDVKESSYFYKAVLWALENNVTGGMTDDTFGPDEKCTRAQMVTFLWRAAGSPWASANKHFADVPENAYYKDAVEWAVAAGITTGVTEDRFDPNGVVTREQLASFIYRYAQSKGQGFTGEWMFNLDYSDAGKISSWADEAMHWCVMKEIIGGTGEGKLSPQGTATRAQIVTMLYRYFSL